MDTRSLKIKDITMEARIQPGKDLVQIKSIWIALNAMQLVKLVNILTYWFQLATVSNDEPG